MSKTISIIGAGIVGVSSALWLQEAGYQVTLIDKEHPGHGTSFGNACTFADNAVIPIATTGILKRLPQMLFMKDSPLAIRWHYLPWLTRWLYHFIRSARPTEVVRLSKILSDLLSGASEAYDHIIEKTNTRDLFIHKGAIHLYDSDATKRHALENVKIREELNVEMRELSVAEIQDLEPNIARLYMGGHYYPTGFHVLDPLTFVERCIATFLSNGGHYLHQEVTHVSSDNKSAEIIFSGGNKLKSDIALITCGAWSKKICQQLGDKPLLDTERGYHVMFDVEEPLLNHPICWSKTGFYLTPMSENRIRIAGTVELGGLKAPPWQARIDMLTRGAKKLLPDLTEPTSTWLGFRPSMPDSIPVISQSDHHKNIYYAFGHGHLGLTMGPITGKLIKELINGEETSVDLSPLKVNRF